MTGEGTVRLSVFLALLVLFAVWEAASPARAREVPRLVRWSNALGLVVLDSVLVRVVFPVTAAGLALWAEGAGWGLFNHLGLPGWVEFVLAVLLFDLAIWAQHVVFHAVPALWRLHRVHHADPDFDVTTGLRFHPAEILLSMAFKFALVLVLGPPALAVLAFEVLLNGTALFTHANLSLPPALDRALRRVVVTPDMHRIHHSVRRAESDSNYGFALALWDRLFRTYRAEAEGVLVIGQERFREAGEQRLDRLLLQPLRNG